MTLVRTPIADATRRRILKNTPLLMMLDPVAREELIRMYAEAGLDKQEEKSNG